MASIKYHTGKFPPARSDIDLYELSPLLGPAHAALAHYDEALQSIPEPQVLLAPLLGKESEVSSRIEGTQATYSEVLEFEAGEKPESEQKQQDIEELINYKNALIYGTEQINNDLPICGRVIKSCHELLLNSVRGKDKAPGQYKKFPNKIGDNHGNILYEPIAPENTEDAIAKWEKYANTHESLDRLIQTGIMHVEFEAIHPFNDGNGRLGRMLIPLYLYSLKTISAPALYVSEYFEKNRDEYYDRLRAVSSDNDWTGWSKFFLTAIKEQSESNLKKVKQIIKLKEVSFDRIFAATGSKHANVINNYIFSNPMFHGNVFLEGENISTDTIRTILRKISSDENKIVSVSRKGAGRRPTLYAFLDLINIAG